jgi:mutator protein MutT
MRSAAVMIIINDGLILGMPRRNDKSKFGLPGGKVEPGETAIDAAKRETFEETGLKVTECSFIFKRVELRHNPDGEDFETYCFYANSWSGNLVSSDEGEPSWITSNDLANGSFPEYNMKTLEIFKTLYPDNHLK